MKPCKLWAGAKTSHGYGHKRVNGKHVKVHRLAYCEHNGLTLADIEGKVIRHKCDNPACYEGTHLEEGSQLDNIHDRVVRGRNGKPWVRTAETQARIMEMHHAGYFQHEIAKATGTSAGTVNRAIKENRA